MKISGYIGKYFSAEILLTRECSYSIRRVTFVNNTKTMIKMTG